MSDTSRSALSTMTPKEAIANERRARAALDRATAEGDADAVAAATELLAVVVAEREQLLAGWERYHDAERGGNS